MRLTVLRAAQEQLGEAIEFYGSIRKVLGAAFMKEVKRGYAQLRREPLTGSPIEFDERKLVLRGFPYSLIYRIEDETIVILCVAHHRREFGFWRDER